MASHVKLQSITGIDILRAVRTNARADKETGVIAVQVAAAHDVGRDLGWRLAVIELSTYLVSGYEGLAR